MRLYQSPKTYHDILRQPQRQQRMTNNITATFIRKRVQDSGKDQAPDYYVYEFTDIVDCNGKKYTDKWIKETKLMQAVTFQKGKQYQILLSDRPFSMDSINLPYPTEVSWDKEKVYLKGGNSIIRVDQNRQEINLSVPLNKTHRTNNYETAARNKFGKGTMTEELLLKMNSRGIFYFVHDYDPQDKRKRGGCCYGSTTKVQGNYILIQKRTQAEIDRDLDYIKRNYVTPSIEKHFKINIELLQPEKRK
jgi:hypothetical protein